MKRFSMALLVGIVLLPITTSHGCSWSSRKHVSAALVLAGALGVLWYADITAEPQAITSKIDIPWPTGGRVRILRPLSGLSPELSREVLQKLVKLLASPPTSTAASSHGPLPIVCALKHGGGICHLLRHKEYVLHHDTTTVAELTVTWRELKVQVMNRPEKVSWIRARVGDETPLLYGELPADPEIDE